MVQDNWKDNGRRTANDEVRLSKTAGTVKKRLKKKLDISFLFQSEFTEKSGMTV